MTVNISDLTALLKNSLRAIFVTATLTLCAVSAAQEYTVNLKDTDIQEFIKFVADVTGTTDGGGPECKGEGQGNLIEAGVTGRAL
jgi:general secretion pathway protein D